MSGQHDIQVARPVHFGNNVDVIDPMLASQGREMGMQDLSPDAQWTVSEHGNITGENPAVSAPPTSALTIPITSGQATSAAAPRRVPVYVSDINSIDRAYDILAHSEAADCVPLFIAQDDIPMVKISDRHVIVQQIFDAVFHPGVLAPALGPKQTLTEAKRTAFLELQTSPMSKIENACTKTVAQEKALRASCYKLLNDVIHFHEHGVDSDFYASATATRTADRTQSLDADLICSSRIQRIIQAIKDYNTIAFDIASRKYMVKLIADPAQCVATKTQSFISNGSRRVTRLKIVAVGVEVGILKEKGSSKVGAKSLPKGKKAAAQGMAGSEASATGEQIGGLASINMKTEAFGGHGATDQGRKRKSTAQVFAREDSEHGDMDEPTGGHRTLDATAQHVARGYNEDDEYEEAEEEIRPRKAVAAPVVRGLRKVGDGGFASGAKAKITKKRTLAEFAEDEYQGPATKKTRGIAQGTRKVGVDLLSADISGTDTVKAKPKGRSQASKTPRVARQAADEDGNEYVAKEPVRRSQRQTKSKKG